MKKILLRRSVMKTMVQNSLVLLALVCLIPFQAFAKDTRDHAFTVALDAGHGGDDQGVKISGDQYEKDLTLEIVRELKKNLDRTGRIQSVLTRSGNESPNLRGRVQTAQTRRADLILSIHVNAGFSKGSTGYEMYFPGFRSPESGKNDSGEIIRDMVRTNYLNESIRFMKLVQTRLDKVFPRKDRGLREGPIGLSGQNIPTVVLEIGFATNAKDRKILLDEDTRKSVVEALSGSLQEYAASK